MLNEEEFIKTVNEDGSILFTPKKPKLDRLQPRHGEHYHTTDTTGGIRHFTWDDDGTDKAAFADFLCYATPAMVAKATKLNRRAHAITMACLLVEPDCDTLGLTTPDNNREKWSVCYSIRTKKWCTNDWVTIKPTTVSVSSRASAKLVCKLLTKWGIS